MFGMFNNLVGRIDPNFQPPTHIDTASKLIIIFINILIGIAFSLGIVAVTAGFLSLTLSQGNPEKTKKAWNTVLYGVIGFVMSLLVVALKTMFVKMVGVENPEIVNSPEF